MDLGGGAEVKTNFFRIWSCCISNPTQGVGSKGQTISFPVSSHVAYQIKAEEASATW